MKLTFKLTIIAALCFLGQNIALSQDAQTSSYPNLWDMHHYVYEDYISAYDFAFREEAVPYWWAIGLSSAALMTYDDILISKAEWLGKKWGIASKDNTKAFIEYKGLPILRAPTDLGSWLYFIGDGWTHSAIALGFLATGSWKDDEKTFNVGFALIEGMITTTIATQTLKHITGHETPNQSTAPNGRWRFFPNQQDYFNNVSKYDAFPSGHLAVSSMTFTIISKSYPDNPWVKPIGITLLSLLSFQMMNNGVHWASDYPLAIGLGYTFGSIAYERSKHITIKHQADNIQWTPIIDNNNLGISMLYQF